MWGYPGEEIEDIAATVEIEYEALPAVVSMQDALDRKALVHSEWGDNILVEIKLEGGEKRVDLVRRVLDAEIPVMGHIGLTPQSLHKMGGFKVQGKDLGGIERLIKDAIALDRAGVFSIVLEGLPREVAAMITKEVSSTTIGIGAGPECDGQVLVFHDIVNLTFAPPAKFVRRYGDVATVIREAVSQFRDDVIAGSYPSDQESYHLPKETKEALEAILARKQMRRVAAGK